MPRMIASLLRLIGLSLLVLIATTWQLWTPQSVFPQVPLFAWAIDVPPTADWIALATIIVGAVGTLAWPHGRWQQAWCGLICIGFLLAVVLDQHRLQPWAYQLVLMSIALTLAPERMAVGLCRMLVASIYIYSALSKLDYTFLATGGMGEQFVATLLGVLRLPNDTPSVLSVGSWLIVIGELLVGILLAMRWPRVSADADSVAERSSPIGQSFRHVGWILAVCLHVTLLVILGPLGMNHSLAVLLWNAMFLILLPLLFVADSRPSATNTSPTRKRVDPSQSTTTDVNVKSIGTHLLAMRACIASIVIGLAIALPLLEPLGWCDTWLAWSLYSSRNEQAIVLTTDALTGEETRVRIDHMSLAHLGVPVYPENRFRAGVTLAMIDRDELDNEVTLVLLGPANRVSGQREVFRLQGADAIHQQAERYWLNAHPRRLPR